MGYHVLAESLGIEEPLTEVDLLDVINNGLPSKGIAILSAKLGITPREMSTYLHVSLKTLQRHQGKVLDINISDRLITIATVFMECVDVFGSEEVAVSWLKSSVPALGNSRPLDYLGTNTGADMVKTLLRRIDYGIFS